MNPELNDVDSVLSGPVGLSDEEIAEFQRLLKEETGAECTPGEARLRAAELIQLYQLLARDRARKGEASQPETEEEPARGKPSRAETDLLLVLADLEASVKLIRLRSKDWAWPVKAAHRLLSTAFIACIEASRDDRPVSPTILDSWRTDNLLALLERLVREGVVVPPDALWVVPRLHRLEHERHMFSVETWQIVADQLPEILRRCVESAAKLLWSDGAQSAILSSKSRVSATVMAEAIMEQLLCHEATVA